MSRRRLSEHCVPLAEDFIDQPWHRGAAFDHTHPLMRLTGSSCSCGFHCARVITSVHCSVPDKVPRVPRMRARRQTIRSEIRSRIISPFLLEKAVGFNRSFIARNRFFEISGPEINVRGHMDHVTRKWHECLESIRLWQCSFRMRGTLIQMNVKMDRARMIRILGQHPIKCLRSFAGTRKWRAVTLPVRPGRMSH